MREEHPASKRGSAGWRTTSCTLAVLLLFATAGAAEDAAPEPRHEAGSGSDEAEPGEKRGFCRTPLSSETLFRSRSSQNLYNGMLYIAGAGAVEFGTDPKTRWTGKNSFDNEIRSAFRGGSSTTRDDAATVSDVMLGLSAGAMPLLSIGKTLSERDCVEAYDMAAEAFEAVSLTLLVTESTKAISGRTRPFVQACDGTPPSDASCNDSDRKQSFFSGHAALAATGAGLTCSYAIKRKTWGDSRTGQVLPCLLGGTAAIATGALRIVADKHWGTDVLVGLSIGATVGWFDTWGPFDLLRFEVDTDHAAGGKMNGIILPYAANGEIGARLGLSF
jgi:hypothetical protein